MKFAIACHVSRGEKTNTYNWTSQKLRAFAAQLDANLSYFRQEVQFDESVDSVIICCKAFDRLFEIHIETVRGEVSVTEFDVTPELADM